MRQFFTKKELKLKKKRLLMMVACMGGIGIVGRLRYSDLA